MIVNKFLDAGGYGPVSVTAGVDIIPLMKAQWSNLTSTDNFLIQEIVIKVSSNTTIIINSGVSIPVNSTDGYSNSSVLIGSLIFGDNVTVEIIYNF
jgi:hypothetical protein